jgi:hypothetical protein
MELGDPLSTSGIHLMNQEYDELKIYDFSLVMDKKIF